MPDTGFEHRPALDPRKFRDPRFTASGEPRATVALTRLTTLWFNTGSLCNITCENCYIESSPRNDRLAYLSLDEVRIFLDDIEALTPRVEEIGFTGGEPFLNRSFPAMLEQTLARGYRALVLTNAMKPMHRRKDALAILLARHGRALEVRVSIDHFDPLRHEVVRGQGTWKPVIEGLRWLCDSGFRVAVAARARWGEPESAMRAGFAALFEREGLPIQTDDPGELVLFPEMDVRADVPEITTRCWGILGKTPEQMMCASSRMVVKRKGDVRPSVVPCTLLPYDPQFALGRTIADAERIVSLNYPFCAQFCVLGGASCSAKETAR